MAGSRSVSDPVPASELPRDFPSITLSVPIVAVENGSTKIAGVLAASITLTDNFFSMLEPLEVEGTSAVSVTASDQTLFSNQETFNRSISRSATLENTGWTVTVSQNRETLDQRLRDLAVLQGLSLLFVFGAVVGFGFWEYRSNLTQTERLLDGFDRIREGEYEYRLDMASAEEWRQISDGFNDLAQGLATREAQLREREQRLSVLNRVLRHNLRNEMTVILNYAELVRELSERDQPRQAAETILDTGRDLADLSEKARQIEEALDAAEAGLREQDIIEILDGVLGDLHEEYPDADVRLHAPDNQTVAGIQSLWIAVRNVCENAVKHNDAEHPEVIVDVEPYERDGEPRVFVRVADDGPGIPEQEKSVLVQGRETSLEHGSGLGLWLVYWVVDKSDGHLRFDENDPRGSVVTMDLHATVPVDHTPSSPRVAADGELVAADDD
jgi:signal transduction histidine kinase